MVKPLFRYFTFLFFALTWGTAFAGSLRLAWDPPPNYGIAGYHVYRSDSSGGPYKRLTTDPVSECEYLDETAVTGHQYFYVVTTVGAAGNESAYSSELAALLGNYDAVPEPGALLARAGADLTVLEGDMVLLTGNHRDPEGKIVTYQWSQVSGTAVSISGIDRAAAGFLAPLVQVDAVLMFALTVTDSGGGSTTDFIRVTVRKR
jgi:fibronectin type 3 domain-containing protein